MKKILVLFMLLMVITANCFASSINQEFENTNIEQVKHGIVKAISIFSAKTNLVEKDDNTIVLFNVVDTVDKNNKFMYRDKKDIICELVQKGNNVEMTLSSKYERIYANGTNEVEEYDNVKELKAVLNSVKRVFFDSYVYGIASSREIKDNGVIINVAENSSAAKAGMKTGDCLISINGKSVVDNFEDFNMGQLVDIFSSEPATFVIVQDGIEKTIVVEPDKINAIGVK
jgi:C-terminal processing protease CtpA/Prc